MMDQLEKTPNSDSKASLQQNLEGKIVDLQAQLRTVREQIEKGQLVDKQSPPPKAVIGGRFGNAASGGRFGNSPRFHGGRGSYMGRGRFGGYGGRGYGYNNDFQDQYGSANDNYATNIAETIPEAPQANIQPVEM